MPRALRTSRKDDGNAIGVGEKTGAGEPEDRLAQHPIRHS